MGRRKKRRRIGHITDAENEKVARASIGAQNFCFDEFKGRDRTVCLRGVSKVTGLLMASGFMPGLRV